MSHSAIFRVQSKFCSSVRSFPRQVYSRQLQPKRGLLQEQTSEESPSAKPTSKANLRPFSDIPKEKGLPYFGTFFDIVKHFNDFFWVHVDRIKKHGNIWRERPFPWLKNDVVYIVDPKDISEMFKAEGKIPQRMDIPGFQDIRDGASLSTPPGHLGIIFSKGEAWLKQRQPLSRYMMMPKMVNLYQEDFNHLSRRLVQVLEEKREMDNDCHVVNVESVLRNWSFESTTKFVLGKSLAQLDGEAVGNPVVAEFIACVKTMGECNAKAAREPALLRKLGFNANYKAALKAQDTVLQLGAKLLTAKMAEIDKMSKEELANTERHDFFTFMLTNSELGMETIILNTIDLLSAGIDTTSNTLLCLLYCLSTSPDVQAKLRAEISSVVGDSEQVTVEHLHHMTLLRNCIRESQRMFPIVLAHSRYVQSDVVLSGFEVPAGTLVFVPSYASSRHPDNFHHPDDFIPDRWLHMDDRDSRFAALPFSFGVRSCVGRRIAELVIKIATTQIVRNFDLQYLSEEPIHLGTKSLIIIPDKPVHIGFRDCNTM